MTKEKLGYFVGHVIRALVASCLLIVAAYEVYKLAAKVKVGTTGAGVVVALQATLFILGLFNIASYLLGYLRAGRDEERAFLRRVSEKSGGKYWSPRMY